MNKENYKITITSKEYFNKYFALKKGISQKTLLNAVSDLYTDLNELQNKFNDDEHLNNIKMRLIDDNHYLIRNIIKENILIKEGDKTYTSCSLSETCSFIKHILIYDVLKIKPIFEDDFKIYDDLYKDWIHLSDYKAKNRESPQRYILKKLGFNAKGVKK